MIFNKLISIDYNAILITVIVIAVLLFVIYFTIIILSFIFMKSFKNKLKKGRRSINLILFQKNDCLLKLGELYKDKLNWEIGNVTENDDNTATIEVRITTKDFQTIVNNYMQKALEAVRGAITGSGSDESFSSADFESYFVEELQNEDIQTTTINTTINAVKEDKDWKIVSDDALVNALLPGLQETVDSLS